MIIPVIVGMCLALLYRCHKAIGLSFSSFGAFIHDRISAAWIAMATCTLLTLLLLAINYGFNMDIGYAVLMVWPFLWLCSCDVLWVKGFLSDYTGWRQKTKPLAYVLESFALVLKELALQSFTVLIAIDSVLKHGVI